MVSHGGTKVRPSIILAKVVPRTTNSPPQHTGTVTAPIEEAEDFILCFFCHLSSDKYEQLRKKEAASVIPEYNNEQLVHCLGLIHGAPKGESENDRREALLKWTQCTRSERVTMSMTKTEMQTFATDKGLYDQMKWSRGVSTLRVDLANLLYRLEYGDDGDDFVEVEAGENGYLVEFLRSAFLPSAKKGREEGQTQHMTQGHRVEKPFLEEFFEITLFQHDLKKFYIPGKQVAEPPEDWKNAFNYKSLKSLNLDEESFKYKLGLWRVLNIDITNKDRRIRTSRTIRYPLPPTMTINPLSIAMWDSLKGGGDKITKLIDNVQERIGIRSDNTTATARLLMYFAIAFHRGNQWCHAKEDLSFYPTIAHARHANNERAAMYDSLSTLSTMLLAKSRSAALQTPTAGLDSEEGQTIQLESLVIPNADQDDSRRRKTRKSVNTTPDPVQMPFASFKTGWDSC